MPLPHSEHSNEPEKAGAIKIGRVILFNRSSYGYFILLDTIAIFFFVMLAYRRTQFLHLFGHFTWHSEHFLPDF